MSVSRAISTAWGPDAITATQRQRNLDAFLDLAVEYENHCASQHEAATLTGFLFWVENPTSPALDLPAGGDRRRRRPRPDLSSREGPRVASRRSN